MRYLLVFSLLIITQTQILAQRADSLKILSWNVFLRPGVLSDQQKERSDSIASYLLKSGADVLVLQEVFHKKSRKKLIQSLDHTYPFHTKPGKKSFWGVPSGVMIFSKDSIRSEDHIYYRKAKGSDRLARKGAIGITIVHDGHPVHIIGTHLQSGEGLKRALIRRQQIWDLSHHFLIEDSADVIFTGDFNVNHTDTLFDFLEFVTVSRHSLPSSATKCTANFADHHLYEVNGDPRWIDFIFLSQQAFMRSRHSFIEEPRQIIGTEARRLSDHNPIVEVFEW